MSVTIHKMLMPSWERHKAAWCNCTRCPLAHERQQVILYRGFLPCDVLFVGEAPGESENVRGEPFVGPAGQLLNSLIAEVEVGGSTKDPGFRYGVTNIVACIPWDGDEGHTREPKKEEAAACSNRLAEIMRLAQPRLVACLGRVAQRFLPRDFGSFTDCHKPEVIHLVHPAAILREVNEVNSGTAALMEKRFIVTLKAKLEEVLCKR